MLSGMSRLALLAALFVAGCSGCSTPAKEPTESPDPKGGEKKVIIPDGKGPKGGGPTIGSATDDSRFHLKPDEGTLTIDKADAKAGAEATATLKLAPNVGFHVATDYPIKITLEPADGVTLAKAELTAGGRDKAQGDAATLSEQMLVFPIKATAAKAGAYEIKGWFKFGVCDKDSCHPKKQPITITVAAS
jgi:hypothetical protein